MFLYGLGAEQKAASQFADRARARHRRARSRRSGCCSRAARVLSWRHVLPRQRDRCCCCSPARCSVGGIEKLIALGVLPALIDPVWDTSRAARRLRPRRRPASRRSPAIARKPALLPLLALGRVLDRLVPFAAAPRQARTPPPGARPPSRPARRTQLSRRARDAAPRPPAHPQVKCDAAGRARAGDSFSASHDRHAAPDLSQAAHRPRPRAAAPAATRRSWVWLALVAVAGRRRRAGSRCSRASRPCRRRPSSPTYPSQQFVVLNATGYVVAQRKAAISSKATGRLEWLGVAEGSRVKAGDVIARIDNRDVVAQAQSAEANVARGARGARAGAGRGARTPTSQLKRNAGPRRARASSRSRRSTRRRRAPIAPRPASPTRAPTSAPREANARNAQVAVDYTRDPRAVRRRDPVEERERRRHRHAVLDRGRFEGRRRDDGRHEHARSRGRRVRIEPRRRSSVGQPAEIVLDALPDTRFRGRISRMVPTVDRAKATVMTKVQLRRDRSAHAAGDEREGELPVAGRDAPSSRSRCVAVQSRRDRRSATAARSCSSCATARPSRCR